MNPLSHGQQALRLAHQLSPESSAYNVPLAWWVGMPLDVEALRHVFERIVERHEPLRTVYPLSGDGFAQEVLDPPCLDFEVRHGGGDRDLSEELQAEAYRPFDLAAGPVLRVRLWQRDDRAWLLLVVAHHIALDGWSIQLLLQEMRAFYTAIRRREPSGLEPLPTTYRQHVAAQGGRWEGEAGRQLRESWLRRLEGMPRVLELPLDRPRRALSADRGGAIVGRLEADLVGRVQALARRHRVTPFTVLLAVFQALLGRYSGEERLVVGTPVAGRAEPEASVLIGYFVNLLALGADLSGDPTFERFVDRARDVVLDAFDQQHYPFGLLASELAGERMPGRHPVFQVVFTLLPPPLPDLPDLYAGRMGFADGRLELGELSLEPVPLDEGAARFDLTLLVAPRGDELALRLQYDAHLFDGTTSRRMLGHFCTLLAGALERPDARLSWLPWLSPVESHQLLAEWNGTSDPPAGPESVQERFAVHARQRPDAVALVFGAQQWTYGRLARHAGRVAAALAGAGAGPETRVGICMARSPELLGAIVGILAAGCAYVPLDPDYPPDRLRFLVEDSDAALILTDRVGEQALAATPARRLVVTGTIGEREEPALPIRRIEPGQLAYVIYTSGSTGRPKGVGVTYDNVARLLSSTQPWFGFGPADTWTLFHSYAFDFSVWEIWGALAHGGRLVVVPEEVRRDPAAFRRLLLERGVTVLNQTPSAFHQLVRADEEAGEVAPLALRAVVFGGEALELAALRPWVARHGTERPRLINMYGITETTVHVTYRPIALGDLTAGRGSVVGAPIPDLEIHLLDRFQRLVPIGVAGELCVGGAGLARGYLGHPALTAQRFVPDPTGRRPGGRLYRSGDLARRLGDGDLEYLGRIDSQVKIRGHRIELGEVEAVLADHPDLGQAVVTTRRGSEETRLVAYVVPRGGAAAPSVESMRAFLRQRLPEYMVPAVFVPLAGLPLTAHGKLDRAALPAPVVERSGLEQEFEAPGSHAERILAGVWQEVLEVERVGRQDAFFALGGDSIRGVQIVSQARRRGLEITLADLFRNSTVAALAAAARRSPADAGSEGVTSEPPGPFELLVERDRERLPPDAEDAYPLTALQIGMLVEGERPTDSAPLYHNVNGLRLRARFERASLKHALKALLTRHPILRSSFHLTGFSEPLQMVHRRVEARCPIIDLTALPSAERQRQVERWLAGEAVRRYDLGRAPLLRFAAHRLDDDTFHLGFSEHHVLADGWSMAVVRSELLRLYAAALGDPAPPVPPPPRGSFATFVAAERQAVADEEARQVWRRAMAGAPLARLPRRAGRVAPRRSVMYRDVFLTGTTFAGLRRRAESLGVPLKSVLLAAHLRVVARLTGESDVVTGVVTHGRPEIDDGERMVGLFVNSLPVRLPVPAVSGRDLVRAAAAAERELLAHRFFPLAEIQALAGDRRLFEVLFNFVHFHISHDLRRLSQVELLERTFSAETEMPLVATFRLAPSGDRLEVRLEADVAELAPEDVARFASVYARAMELLSEDPEALATDSLLPAAERHQLLAEWCHGRPVPPAATLPALFAEQVARRPDAPALVCGDRALTYDGLSAAADHLAHRLRRHGVVRGTRVGLLLERSMEAIVGILAVLKAGGTYVPLDAEYPEERLHWMLRDAEIALLVARRPGDVAMSWRVPSLYMDEETAGPATAERLPPLPEVAGVDDLAYVMFTSGSTGRPKGVAITHRAVARLVADGDYGYLGPEETWLQLAPLSFDAATLEIWAALGRGGRLVVKPPGPVSLESLAQVIRERKVTSLWLTAGLFHQVVREDPRPLAVLRQLLAGGDVLSPALVRRFLEAAPETRLINGYGPTENTTFTACHSMSGALEASALAGGVPLGRPIPGTRTYVVGRDLLPAPVGVTGELVTGGYGLARGYVGQPAHTAERFVPDPFSTTPGERLYLTGDLARWNPDGRLEFLGRCDGQVKVRGFRVETAEVAEALERHPGVRGAVVVARGEDAESKELVAYVVPRRPAPGEAELRDFLAAVLPGYMVPARYGFLEAFPLDPNGKVDRRALPALQAPAGTAAPAAPRGPLEELVTGVWNRLLAEGAASGPLGAADDVFACGAHSLTAVRAASRLRAALGRDVPLGLLFKYPTPALQAAALDALGESMPRPPLSPRPAGAAAPLSPAQERIWFFQRLEPEASTYNVPLVCRLTGSLNAVALAAALRAVVERHEVLRTVYRRGGDGPVQEVVARRSRGSWPRVDLSRLSAGRRAAVGWALAGEVGRRPFDLAAGPPLRARLLTLSATDHLLALAVHHVAFDGGSVAVFHRELAALYDAGCAPADLPPLPVQYADYAVWQRRELAGEEAAVSLRHWRRRLAGSSGLELPADRPRPAVRTSRGSRVERALPAALVRAVDALAGELTATRFMVWAAGFAALLARLADRADVVFGTPAAHREPPEVELLVGCFVNPLVQRIDARGDSTVEELVRQVRELAVTDYPHASFPFERLVDELAVERDLARPPLFQILFAVQDSDASALSLEGVEVEPRPVDLRAAKLDLAVEVDTSARRPVLAASFSSDLYDATTVARYLGAFETLLADALDRSGRRLSELGLMQGAERHQVLHEWGDGGGALLRGPVHRRLAAWTERAPDRVAVIAEEGHLTYGALRRRARLLAQRLRRLGAGPEVTVGVALPRTIELLPAVLGILEAGASYLPVDLDHPAERLAYVLEDAAAQLLITQRSLQGRLPHCPARLVFVDEPGLVHEIEAGGGRASGEVAEDPHLLAYSIYTSGSTGRPKGVRVSHGALGNLICDVARRLDMAPGRRFLALTALSFDIATFELLAPLVTGGTVVLGGAKLAADGTALGRELVASGADFAQTTPASWRVLAASRWGGAPGLTALTAGEALPPPLAREISARCAGLWNLYGPTETTIYSTLARVHRDGEVSLGRPLAGTRIYVTSRDLTLCPASIPGEVSIGGVGVGRGYQGRPAMTAERFVPDPFSGRAGERLYRTGDLGRWRADGCLEYLGRLDHQVKLRGFRIELGEIETLLQSHPDISGAVVGTRGTDPTDCRLVAWYTAAEAFPVERLTAFLRERLPDYMVPAAFLHLDAFPQTPNRKIDRKALPDPGTVRPHLATRFLAPESELERSVAGVWRQVLRLDEVGLDDNFFDLGGDSLLAVEVLDRLPVAEVRRLTLIDLFRFPTVGSLAGFLGGASVDRLSTVADRASRRRAARQGRRGA